jgi:hypothetical protein
VRSLIPWTLLFAVVCAGAPAFGQAIAEKEDAPSRADFALLDRLTLAVAVFEVGKHWRGPEGEDLRAISDAHPLIITSDPSALADKAGISLRKIDRVLLTMGRGQLIYAATFSDAAALVSARKSLFPAGTEETVEGRKILLGGAAGRAGYELTDRILVIGDAPEIREIATGRVTAQPNPAMIAFRTVLADEPLAALQVDAASIGPRLRGVAAEHGLAPLSEARVWRLVCRTSDAGLKISLSAEFDQPAQAAAAVDASRKLQSTLVDYLSFASLQTAGLFREQAKEFPGGAVMATPFETSAKRVRVAFGAASPRVEGGVLSLDCEVPTATPVVDAVFLMTLMPRAAKPEPPDQQNQQDRRDQP